jgi:hypothetical protein
MYFVTNKAKLPDPSVEFQRKYPHPHYRIPMVNRPDMTRRAFFGLTAGLTGSFLLPRASASTIVKNSGKPTKGTAKNVIFVHLLGAMSHVDTLDLKVINGTTPASFNPTMVNGVNWPMGLLPKIGSHLGDIGIVRSVTAHALVHSLAQTWTQIGRSPVQALGDVAPNVGSIIALEMDTRGDRKPGQVFPTFVGLNAGAASTQGYLDAKYAPFQVVPRNNASGVPNTTNSAGTATFNAMYTRLGQYDGVMRSQSPYGDELSAMDYMYKQARDLMYNPLVDSTFTAGSTDGIRYGNGTAQTSFGNACLLAKQILQADQGTRFIQIDTGGWDHHQNIYDANNLPLRATDLDNGLGALIDDLKAIGKFDETLIVVMGEFGRTPGVVTAAGGRDHYSIQSVMLAGGGIKGGTVVGATNDTGDKPGGTISDFGWSGSGLGPRTAWVEDIEATIYTAMGIDWTTIRYDDPFGRGYEYVPFAKDGTYGPINELFS